MARQKGHVKYVGTIGDIRHFKIKGQKGYFAGLTGGPSGEQVATDPAFERTRENMNEFGGCGVAVKAIRRGLLNLLPEQADKHFTGRLMKVVKEINRRDYEGVRGKRAIIFSGERTFLSTIVFNVLQDIAEVMGYQFAYEHPITRASAKLTLTDLTIKPILIPKGATHYRVQNHISIISDYTYVEANRRYEPLSQLNTLSAFAYSEYTPVGTALTDEINAAFPTGTAPSTDDSVIQCVGIEFYVKSATNSYLPLQGSSIKVVDIF